MDVVVQVNTRLVMIMIMAVITRLKNCLINTHSCHFNQIQAVLLIQVLYGTFPWISPFNAFAFIVVSSSKCRTFSLEVVYQDSKLNMTQEGPHKRNFLEISSQFWLTFWIFGTTEKQPSKFHFGKKAHFGYYRIVLTRSFGIGSFPTPSSFFSTVCATQLLRAA